MRLPRLLSLALLAASAVTALAHPIPDIPVQASFDTAGAGTIRVEVDLRFFEADPATAPYLNNEALPTKPDAWRVEQIEKANAFAARYIEFFLEPGGRLTPEFHWDFTGMKNSALTKADDPVMLTGTWTTPPGLRGYHLRSTQENRWSVLFLNQVRGHDIERTQVLFPGESSFVLDVTPPSAAASPAPAKAATLSWWQRWFGIR